MASKKTTRKTATKKKTAKKKAVKRAKKSAPKTAEKTTRKTATKKKTVRGKPFKKGDDPRRGKGPAKGAPNAGRPPDAFRREMRDMLWSDLVPKLKKLVKNEELDSELLLKVFRELADRGYGKAPVAVEIKEELTDDERMERMRRFLRIMVERDPDGMKAVLTHLTNEAGG